MAQSKKNLGRPTNPAIKPPSHFGPRTEGVSPEDARRIIEGRKVSLSIVRPNSNRETKIEGGNQ